MSAESSNILSSYSAKCLENTKLDKQIQVFSFNHENDEKLKY